MAPGGGWLRTGSGPAAVVEGRSQSLLPCRQWPAPQKAPWPARACGRDWDADGSSLGPVCSPLWDGWARRLIWGPADLPGQGPLCRRGGCPRPREQQGTLCANFWGHHARCGHPRAAPSPTVPGAGSRGQPSLRREAGNGWTRAHTRRREPLLKIQLCAYCTKLVCILVFFCSAFLLLINKTSWSSFLLRRCALHCFCHFSSFCR